ncbi:MAG: sigma 54-interacting transcriptional regulator [Bacillota bacterium]
MLTAQDVMLNLPAPVQLRDQAASVLSVLLCSKDGLAALAEGRHITGIITLSSALRALTGGRLLDQLTAGDLVQAEPAPLKPDTPWLDFWKELRRCGALPVADAAGNLCGAVTTAALGFKLGIKNEELERELDAIINFSSDEILVADGAGLILRANAAFEDNFGVKVADVLGKKVSELEKQKIFFPSVTRLVLQKKSAQTVIQSQRSGRKFLATGTPAFNSDGSVFRVIVNTRDITRLNKLKQQLEEAQQLKNRYYQELVELRQGCATVGEIVASSAPMLELMRTAQKVAPAGSTVFLTGESGVGKGLVARFIHEQSPRREKPFITVNCGAIPENLLESELFGYAGGAFSGARGEGKIGKMELADEGTLFLDEITELPLNLQVKLLHVIQEGIISRLGDTKEKQLNLRIIAASNRKVEQLVAAGGFREDLYFRLNVIPLEVPPLRERPDDIEPLTNRFLEQFNRQYHQQKQLDRSVFTVLKTYPWPGNVRELENLVERLLIVADTDTVTIKHLPRHISGAAASPAPGQSAAFSLPLQPLKQAKECVEKELLRQAISRCRTTYEIAALLEIDQSTVVRKLQKYHLPPPDGELHQD